MTSKEISGGVVHELPGDLQNPSPLTLQR